MTINLHGKDYVEVKDRVVSAHADESYSMLREETFSMGGREYVRVYIEVKGKQYIGTAECKFNANPKTPDGQSPFECGETSALGRALGFAGYGAVESIASADEVVRNQQQERAASNGNGHKPAQDMTGGPAPIDNDPYSWANVLQRGRDSRLFTAKGAWTAFLQECFPGEEASEIAESPAKRAIIAGEIKKRIAAATSGK